MTSAVRTTASSVVSGLSLNEVSNVSILAVPIYAREISNSHRYTFGDFTLELQGNHEENSTVQSSAAVSRPNLCDRFASAVGRQARDKPPKSEASKKPEPHVLAVSLYESVKIANVSISPTNEADESF